MKTDDHPDLFQWGELWQAVNPRFRGHRFTLPTLGLSHEIRATYDLLKKELGAGIVPFVQAGETCFTFGGDARMVHSINPAIFIASQDGEDVASFTTIGPGALPSALLQSLVAAGLRVALAGEPGKNSS